MRSFGDHPRDVDTLLEQCRSDDPDVRLLAVTRLEAAEALGELGDAAAVDALGAARR